MGESKQRHWWTIILIILLTMLITFIGFAEQGRWTDLLPLENLRIFFYPLVTLLITVIVAKLVSMLLHKYFQKVSKHLKVVDKTRFILFAQLTTLLIYIVGIAVAGSFVPALRNLSVSLFAGAGVLAIVIGFATQKTLGNLFSGTMIAMYQPYRIGDRIKVGDEYGEVEDINLRQTMIRTWDNRRIVIPNSKMDEEVINNYTIKDAKILGWFDTGISYDSDIDLARQIMIDSVKKHEDYFDNRSADDLLQGLDPVTVRVIETADFSVQLRLYFWAKNQPTAWKMKTELREQIAKRFAKEGVEIPFPYRTIVQKKDLPKPKQAKSKKK